MCGREESRCVGRGGKGPRAGEGRGPAREGESAESRRGPLGPRLFFTPRSLASPDFARDTPLPAKAVTRLAPQTSDRLVRAAGRPRCRGWRAIVGGGAGAVVGVAGEEQNARGRQRPLGERASGKQGGPSGPPLFHPRLRPPHPPNPHRASRRWNMRCLARLVGGGSGCRTGGGGGWSGRAVERRQRRGASVSKEESASPPPPPTRRPILTPFLPSHGSQTRASFRLPHPGSLPHPGAEVLPTN